MSTERSDENDPLDQRWFEVDSDKWAEVVRILERAPEPKPRLADLLRERSMFASQQGCHCGMPDTASEIPGSAIIHGPYACKTEPTTPARRRPERGVMSEACDCGGIGSGCSCERETTPADVPGQGEVEGLADALRAAGIEVGSVNGARFRTVVAERILASDWLAERDAEVARAAWDEALDHVWRLSDPAYTIVAGTQASKLLVTEADIEQAKHENPHATEPRA